MTVLDKPVSERAKERYVRRICQIDPKAHLIGVRQDYRIEQDLN
jgi:hypothetical protein